MAAEKTQEWTEATNGAAANANPGDGWNAVEDEVKMDLEEIGDGFIGTYMRKDPPTASGIVQLHFEDVTDLNGNFIAKRAFINSTRDLTNKIAAVPFRRQVRAQWTDNMDTGQISPMRVFSVAHR